MSDEKEYLEDDWPELTEEDLAQIDILCEGHARGDAKASIGASVTFPASAHQADQDIKETKYPTSSEFKSPFSQFKLYNYLSVSDIVAPAWCEVQFDYGLRQFRHRPVEQRPSTFVSEKGKKIIVKKSTAVNNDKVQKKGQVCLKLTVTQTKSNLNAFRPCTRLLRKKFIKT